MKKIMFFAAISTLAACSTVMHDSPETAVEKRALQRMTALEAGNFKKAYTFMSPGYKTLHSEAVFEADHVGLSGMQGFRILSVECAEEDNCKVSIEGKFNLSAMAPQVRTEQPLITEVVFSETWIRLDGKWWATKAK